MKKHPLGPRTKPGEAMHNFVPRFLVLLFLFILMRVLELAGDSANHGFTKHFTEVFFSGLFKDVAFLLTIAIPLFAVYLLFHLLSSKAANIFFLIAAALICIIQLALIQYFQTTMVPLGGDLWGYSLSDIKQTVGAAGIKTSVIVLLIIAIIVIVLILRWLPEKIKLRGVFINLIFFAALISLLFGFAARAGEVKLNSEYANNLSLDKSWFFYTDSWKHFFPEVNDLDIYADSYSGDYGDEGSASTSTVQTVNYLDETNYPFLHTDNTADVLSPFFDSTLVKPDIVILLVEGLGRAFTNEGAYLGNFTPFIDSLSGRSLYWQNCLSGGGRTFAVLPTLLGSLPFGKNGFAEFGNAMPQHNTLLSLLQYNGYTTSFYYGGDARFDNMSLFLQKGNIDNIHDIASFPQGYTKLPESSAGFSWGYGDKELFRWYLQSHPPQQAPSVSVLLTVATHSPFAINQQQEYLNRFEQRMQEIGFNDDEKQKARKYNLQYASVLFADDAIRKFFTDFSKRPDFNNTIFILTGDHQMPELPMNNKLDRYHVPLIIYSPKLKRTATFSPIVSHFDITPSLLAFLRKNSHIKTPSAASWIGTGLDTVKAFRNIHAYPLMQTKNDLVDFVMGPNMINDVNLYDINNKLELTSTANAPLLERMKGSFDRFKQKNNAVINGAKLIPDSLYNNYRKPN